MASDILFSSFMKAAIPLPPSQWDLSSPVSIHQTSPSSRTDLCKGQEIVLYPTSKSSNLQPTTHPFGQGCDSCSTFFTAPPSVEDLGSEKSTDTSGLYELDLEDFDLEGFTAEEIKAYNSMAEPGQRLQDAMTPKKVAFSMPKPAKHSNQDPISLPIPKQMNLFIRKHPFLEKSLSTFTKSERRQFERNVYDFSRGLGVKKPEARKYVIKAREFCGEEEYDNDVSALEGEMDDSASIIDRLPRTIEPEAILSPSSQGRPKSQTESRSGVKRRVGEDSTVARTPLLSKKRKASTMDEGHHTAPQSELVRINAELAKDKDSAQKSAQNLPIDASKVNLKGAPTESVAKLKEEREARKAAKKARKAEEHMRRRAQASPTDNKPSSHGQHENDTKVVTDYLDYLEEWREFDEDLRNEKEGKAHKKFKEALVEIQNPAEDHQHRKKRQRKTAASEFSPSDDTVSMTAAVEGVSEQCKMLAKEMDDSFRKMVALIDWPTPQNNAYPTPYPSSNEDVSTCPEHPPTLELQSDKFGLSSLSNAEPSTDEHPNLSDGGEGDEYRSESAGFVTPPARKRKIRSIIVSPYFPNSAEKKIKNTASPYFPKPPNTKPKAGDRVSCIPFPPLSSTSFGLVQERLAHDPFRLLVAMIFLNKTRGAIALPVFYELMERYPTPADLAAADLDDVVDIFEHLGLQNQRAMKCINLAKAWLERPPEKGKRYRVLHYPNKNNGKDIKADEILDEDDERVAWEIGQLPGVGAYAIDSWRIFCRDELRGLPNELPKDLTPETEIEEMQKEWTRVLPLDKELRAYLHWLWLRNGWDWNPVTGEKVRADEKTIANAGKGGVICEGAESSIVVGDVES